MNFIFKLLPDSVDNFFAGHPFGNLVRFLISILSGALFIGFLVFVVWIAQKANKKVFRIIESRSGKKIHLQFLERVVNIAIVVIVIIIPLAGDRLGTSILGSAAVLTAVVGFAAQDVIKDVLSGFLISIYKPFDIGDMIELDDGTIGVVESITMRHVVIIRLDNLRDVIPNSRINDIPVINYSIGQDARSWLFEFNVSYDSDVYKTKKVISEAVKESPYSVPGVKNDRGDMVYAPVQFLEMGDSSLKMSVRVYFDRSGNIFEVQDDINTRVFKALGGAGIEIPYSYTNVILKDGSKEQ